LGRPRNPVATAGTDTRPAGASARSLALASLRIADKTLHILEQRATVARVESAHHQEHQPEEEGDHHQEDEDGQDPGARFVIPRRVTEERRV
jgi:hypothetical protein